MEITKERFEPRESRYKIHSEVNTADNRVGYMFHDLVPALLSLHVG